MDALARAFQPVVGDARSHRLKWGQEDFMGRTVFRRTSASFVVGLLVPFHPRRGGLGRAIRPPPPALSVPSCQKSFRVFRVFRGPTLRRLPSVLRRPVRFLRPLRLLAANPPPSVPSVPFCKNPSVYSVFSAMVRGPASGSGRFVSGEKDLSDRWHRRNTEVDPR